MRTALSIAGSDSSGGAGIQADLKTMTMNGVFAMSAITALTAQNTTGVTGILEVSPEFLGQQLDAVFTDIRPDAVKIGMVSSSPLIEKIAERLRFSGLRIREGPQRSCWPCRGKSYAMHKSALSRSFYKPSYAFCAVRPLKPAA